MRQVIVLEEMSPQEAALLAASLAGAEITAAAQELDHLMEGAETPDPLGKLLAERP